MYSTKPFYWRVLSFSCLWLVYNDINLANLLILRLKGAQDFNIFAFFCMYDMINQNILFFLFPLKYV